MIADVQGMQSALMKAFDIKSDAVLTRKEESDAFEEPRASQIDATVPSLMDVQQRKVIIIKKKKSDTRGRRLSSSQISLGFGGGHESVKEVSIDMESSMLNKA